VPNPSETLPVDPARDRFSFATWLFFRALAAIYLIAFISFGTQAAGLIGPHGLLPAQGFLNAVHDQIGARAWLELPSLCWWFGAGQSLPALCAAGIMLAVLLFAGVAPAPCLLGLWAVYLSLCSVGQVFYGYQWDALLLETTLLAIFLAPWSWLPLWRPAEPPRLARWLLLWLLFRLMFLSGAVKLASGDSTWRDLTALTFHYETQPLPTPLAWYAHQLPAWFHRAACAVMFALELIVPFGLGAPRRFRHAAALLIAGFMVFIGLTGNYTFFNFLTVALCLLALDDAWWRRVFRRAASPLTPGIRHVPRRLLRGVAVFVFAYTTLIALPRLLQSPVLAPLLGPVDAVVGPFRSLNSYGLFAVMTHPRPELLIEGSDDGRDWRAYVLPDKPGTLNRAPTWVAPFQPRLDWQLWFAALESPDQNPWLLSLCEHLLRGTPEVLALFAHNPFPRQPPRYIRVVRYDYHFTDRATKARTGDWWRRSPIDYYLGPVSLR
jgi:hypothetical protein